MLCALDGGVFVSKLKMCSERPPKARQAAADDEVASWSGSP